MVNPTWLLGLLVIAETFTLIVYLTGKPSKNSTLDPIALFSTLAATFYLFVVDLKPGLQLAPKAITTALQAAGILCQLWAKVALGRSFGLLPANKGIVRRGPYKLVRHPIYLGYFIAHIGFLLGSWSIHNTIVFAALYAFLFVRIFREESLLKQDPEYVAYCGNTPYRFLPRIF